MKKIKFGFTLGEVLMTLGVIGIIAAMTIPATFENVNEMKYRSSLKTVYSKFAVNLDSVLLNTSAIEGSTPCDSFSCFPEITADTFVDENLFNAAPCVSGCINNDAPNGFNDTDAPQTPAKLYTLANGMTMKVMPRTGGCGYNPNTAIAQYNDLNLDICALVYIDVNGQSKPNNFKNDLFAFYILADKKIQSYNTGVFTTETTRVTNLLPLGLDRERHGKYTSYITNANTTCDMSNLQNSLNCTAEIIDGEGNWKSRHDCWKNHNDNKPSQEYEKIDCNKCTVGTDCYHN